MEMVMTATSLKGKIRKVRNGLEWSVVELPHEVPAIHIFTDPVKRSHVIRMPDKESNRSTDMDYLHELGHALLCEQVHPVFAATGMFVDHREKQQQYNAIVPALNAATDWFVGHWLMELAPKQARELLRENLTLVEGIVKHPEPPPVEIILDASQVIAQAVLYLGKRTDCSGVLQTATDAFLAIPPGEPSADACCRLVNTLMAVYTPQRARLVNDGQIDLWEAYLPADSATEVPVPS
jgi:hypothetical protein